MAEIRKVVQARILKISNFSILGPCVASSLYLADDHAVFTTS